MHALILILGILINTLSITAVPTNWWEELNQDLSSSSTNPPTQESRSLIETAGEEALAHGDCGICFNDFVNSQQLSVFCRNNRRACSHYICRQCANQMRTNMRRAGRQTDACPFCRETFDGLSDVGDLTNPTTVFDLMDSNGDLRLSQNEVVQGVILMNVGGYREQAIRDTVGRHWRSWDTNGDGSLNRNEFANAFYDIQDMLKTLPNAVNPGPPSFENAAAYFDHFDADDSGKLDWNEMFRLLVHALGLRGDREAIEAWYNEWMPLVIGSFDSDGDDKIDRDEFIAFHELYGPQLMEQHRNHQEQPMPVPVTPSMPSQSNSMRNPVMPQRHDAPVPAIDWDRSSPDQVFRMFDLNGDGELTVDEITQHLVRVLGLQFSRHDEYESFRETVEANVVAFDDDYDGVMSHDEFALFFSENKGLLRDFQMQNRRG